MVLFTMRWDILHDKKEAYLPWTESAIRRTLEVPGVVEFRAYRPVTGGAEVAVTYEFADLSTWATWHDHENTQKVFDELRSFTTNLTIELWKPSPVVPKPVRPMR